MPAAALIDAPPGAGSGHWLDDGAVSKLDRLPGLSDALVEVARALTDNFTAVLASPGDVAFHGLESSRVDRLLDRRGGKPVFALARAPGWKSTIALQFDQLFVAVVVHALFGGGEEEFEFPERSSLTSLETRIAGLIAEQVVDAMTKGFADCMPSAFHLEPTKPKPDTALLGKGPTQTLVATFVLHAVGQPVELDVIIPQSAIDPFVERLAKPTETSPHVDHTWSEKLEAEINRARMALEARMVLPSSTLGEIAAFRPGQILEFEAGSAHEVRLSCTGTELFRCDLGQSNGCYSLKITEILETIDPSSHKDR